MRILLISLAFCAFTMLSCTSDKMCGTRVEALDDSAWECSQWISVADAPVVEGKVYNSRNNRAADGAACFMFEYEPPAKARSAKWMTTGRLPSGNVGTVVRTPAGEPQRKLTVR